MLRKQQHPPQPQHQENNTKASHLGIGNTSPASQEDDNDKKDASCSPSSAAHATWRILKTVGTTKRSWIFIVTCVAGILFVVVQLAAFPRGDDETFAQLQGWCQPSSSTGSVFNDNFRRWTNPCSPFDAQLYEHKRNAEIKAGIQRLYYINLEKNVKRRERMERLLRNQTAVGRTGRPLPFKRIPAVIGREDPTVCVPNLRNPLRCSGVQGILKSNLRIMRYEPMTGISFVMEDDFLIKNMSMIEEALTLIPNDWDIIRIECVDYDIRQSFDYIEHPDYLMFRAQFVRPCNGEHENCNYCGGAFAMLLRESSLSKLFRVWSTLPAADLDCRLAHELSIRSYCFNTHRKAGQHAPPPGETTDIPKIGV